MNEDIFLLHDLHFPEDTGRLVELLNKYRFRGHSTWTYDSGSYVVFIGTKLGSGRYYGDFFARLLAQYLECLEYMARLIAQQSEPFETAPYLSILPSYEFYLNPGDCLPDNTYTHRGVIPAQMVRYLQTQLQH